MYQVLKLSDIHSDEALQKYLQCPVLVGSKADELALIVSSRDTNNQSWSFLLTRKYGSWTIESKLGPKSLGADCVGVMITDSYYSHQSQSLTLVGMAFQNFDGKFHSNLFSYETTGLGDLQVPQSGPTWLGTDDSKKRFRTMPRFVISRGKIHGLTYSASQIYPSESEVRTGFPSTYGVFFSRWKTSELEDSLLTWPNPESEAYANATLHLADPNPFLIYSKRSVGPPSSPYRVEVAQLEPGLGSGYSLQQPSTVIDRACYPSHIGVTEEIQLLFSGGNWGERGIWSTCVI